MAKRKHKTNTKLYIIVLSIIIIAMVLLILYFIFPPQSHIQNKQSNSNQEIGFTVKPSLFNSTQAIAYLPAVDDKGNGVLTLLVVEATPGSGRTLVDIDNLLFWGDTQHSIRIAKNVAQNITHINLSNYDLVYNIYANAAVIGGESAGAALTLATIAAIENKTMNNNVIITGTINHDGTIGPVQGILAKAKAAKANGAVLFLVPQLQSTEITYTTNKYCEKFGPGEYCTTEQVPKKINIAEDANITIKEVSTITEAMQYFFKQ